MAQFMVAQAQEKQMCKDFANRAEIARKKYWDACKYPRKIKKKMRKEARTDFTLYSQLSKPMLFTF